jgi:hypothetical protein
MFAVMEPEGLKRWETRSEEWYLDMLCMILKMLRGWNKSKAAS